MISEKSQKLIDEIIHIEELATINKIHSSNYEILSAHLLEFPNLKRSLPGDLISISNDAKVEAWNYMNSLQMFVFNYLSSAKSLIDLTRKHYSNHYKDRGGIDYYDEKIEENFVGSNLHGFIQQFRNYVIHYGTPPLSMSKNINCLDNNKVTHQITLSKKDLLESGFEWNKTSKALFNSEKWGQFQDINVLFREYYLSLKNFQDWYESEQRKIFAKQHALIEVEDIDFSKKIISGVVSHVESKGSFRTSTVVDRLLYCFSFGDATELLAIANVKDRTAEILSRLKKRELLDDKDYQILYVLLVL